MAAGNQAREREIVLHAAMLAGVAPVHHVLHSFPQVPRDQRLMAALVETAIPFELAHVKPVPEDFAPILPTLEYFQKAGRRNPLPLE